MSTFVDWEKDLQTEFVHRCDKLVEHRIQSPVDYRIISVSALLAVKNLQAPAQISVERFVFK